LITRQDPQVHSASNEIGGERVVIIILQHKGHVEQQAVAKIPLAVSFSNGCV